MRLLEEQVTRMWRVDEDGGRTSEGKAAGVYGTGFTVSLWQE
jgi:hypothetical protein